MKNAMKMTEGSRCDNNVVAKKKHKIDFVDIMWYN